MNYLAHAYLSFEDPDILLGNMISDYIKGKKQYDYPSQIQKGIRLHRAIDEFTDNHPITKELKTIFSPTVRLYSGAFVDVVYDHFLALSLEDKTADEWMKFTELSYIQLTINESYFPEKFAKMFPYMKEQNWLYNYRFVWGIEKSFGGLVRRAKYMDDYGNAYEYFIENYSYLAVSSSIFLRDVKKFAKKYFENIKII
jgi:acyl carrier protein phosphodiesterase